jgi:hypothetical protein
MHRLVKYQYIMKASAASKGAVFFIQHSKLSLKLVAGLYKPASVRLEHGLIVASLSGRLPVANYQLHGKSQKRTVSLSSTLNSGTFQALDKIIHELLPRIPDFITPKVRKPSHNNYILRIKQKFAPLPDFEDLISSSMYDEHRGIFLPLSMHFLFGKTLYTRYQTAYHYLRMLRLPFNFYSKRKAPAFDDIATFDQRL